MVLDYRMKEKQLPFFFLKLTAILAIVIRDLPVLWIAPCLQHQTLRLSAQQTGPNQDQ